MPVCISDTLKENGIRLWLPIFLWSVTEFTLLISRKTVVKIDEAASAMKHIAKSGKKVLFVATKKQAKDCCRKS